MNRGEALARLQAQIAAGQPIIGAGAGTGLSAKCAEQGGTDLIIIYNSGRYRMAGRGSLAGLLPYGDANAIVIEMADEVLPVVHDTPVLAGVCGTDPFRLMPNFLREVADAGFAGSTGSATAIPVRKDAAAVAATISRAAIGSPPRSLRTSERGAAQRPPAGRRPRLPR